MIFSETKLKGAFLIEPERKEDHRGFFARTWCQEEFEAHGLIQSWCNAAFHLTTKKELFAECIFRLRHLKKQN